MRYLLSIVAVCWCVTLSGASPKPTSKPAKKPAAAVPVKLTPELQKFAKEMGEAVDTLAGLAAKVDDLERAGKFEEAATNWVSIRDNAEQLEMNAALAGRMGGFGEPMRFPTKKGTLTPKTYVLALRKIAANADLRHGKALVARDAAEDKKRKQPFPEGVAKAVVQLEAQAQQASGLEKRDPGAALRLTKTAIAMATALRQSVASAVKTKRADANTVFPLKPKSATSSEVVSRLDVLIKDQKARVHGLETAVAAAAPKHAASNPAGKAAGGNATTRPVADQPAVAEGEPAETPVSGETCNDESSPSCDIFDRPCCPGKQCLPAGWICGEGCDGLTGQTPDRYSCQDPDLAPKP